MVTMMTKLFHAKTSKCGKCRVEGGDGINYLHVHPDCMAELEAIGKGYDAMALEDFIREVVNGRAELLDSKVHRDALYEQYHQDMPYGTQKARTGDPDEWIFYRLIDEYAHFVEEEVNDE